MEGSAGQKRISANFIQSFRFMCPKSLDGQREVSLLLDLADQEIRIFESYVTNLRAEMAGLLERLCCATKDVSLSTTAAKVTS